MLPKTLLLTALTCLALNAQADSLTPRTGSGKISAGTLSIITAPVMIIGAPALSVGASAGQRDGSPAIGPILAVTGSAFVVTGIVQVSGEVARVMVEAVKGSATLALDISKSSLQASGAAVGASVQATTMASGTVFTTAGKVLAFVPNQLGESLLEHQRVPS